MASLLYVTCNLKPVELSRSLSVGKEFLEAYLRQNPSDEVHFLDLYRDNIQRIDADVLGGWGRMRTGESFASLSLDEQSKIGRIMSGFISRDELSSPPCRATHSRKRRSVMLERHPRRSVPPSERECCFPSAHACGDRPRTP
jgi:hypothetical protein